MDRSIFGMVSLTSVEWLPQCLLDRFPLLVMDIVPVGLLPANLPLADSSANGSLKLLADDFSRLRRSGGSRLWRGHRLSLRRLRRDQQWSDACCEQHLGQTHQ